MIAPPEILQNLFPSLSVDTWQLGCLLFLLCTGVLPFGYPTTLSQLATNIQHFKPYRTERPLDLSRRLKRYEDDNHQTLFPAEGTDSGPVFRHHDPVDPFIGMVDRFSRLQRGKFSVEHTQGLAMAISSMLAWSLPPRSNDHSSVRQMAELRTMMSAPPDRHLEQDHREREAPPYLEAIEDDTGSSSCPPPYSPLPILVHPPDRSPSPPSDSPPAYSPSNSPPPHSRFLIPPLSPSDSPVFPPCSYPYDFPTFSFTRSHPSTAWTTAPRRPTAPRSSRPERPPVTRTREMDDETRSRCLFEDDGPVEEELPAHYRVRQSEDQLLDLMAASIAAKHIERMTRESGVVERLLANSRNGFGSGAEGGESSR